jgi:hydrogenase maturation protease
LSDGVLVAGIGNIFFGDDGFGPAVVTALLGAADTEPLPSGVRVVDYGIRGVHLSYDLLAGVDALVLIDAVPPGTGGQTAPGAVVTLRIGADDVERSGRVDVDAHGLSPVAVLASLKPMGGSLPPTFLVGCIASDVDERMGLSAAVEGSIAAAAETVRELVSRLADPISAAQIGA